MTYQQTARCSALLVLVSFTAGAHSAPTPVPLPPLHVSQTALFDSAGTAFLLRGVELPDADATAATTPLTYRVIQQRWNMNAVRLLVNTATWRRDGPDYLKRIASTVKLANQEGLVVVLAAVGDQTLPNSTTLDFWKACALSFKDSPALIFDVFNEPSTSQIPGSSPTQHRAADWQFWLNGGILTTGQTGVGMQTLVDAIRSAGAQQIIAVASFHDTLDFQGLTADLYVRDPNIIYEVHPYYDHGLTDAERSRSLADLAARFPIYAGAWGAPLDSRQPACDSIPKDVSQASDLILQTLAYFDNRRISWTAADFRPGSLIEDTTDYTATLLDKTWICGDTATPQSGIGGLILLWMTGDPAGFGSIAPDQTASAAGGPARPVAPGQIISLYGQLIGPEIPVGLQLDASGKVPSALAETQVLFDGIAAPILLAGYFQVNVQVPYEVAGRTSTTVQLIYKGVRSNKMQLALVDAAPGIFAYAINLTEAAAFDEGGSKNAQGSPAKPGSIVTLFATGTGITTPPTETGRPAQAPYNPPATPLTLTLDGQEAEILFAGNAPGFVGVTQVNARVPATVPRQAGIQRVPLVLNLGRGSSRPEITLWVAQ